MFDKNKEAGKGKMKLVVVRWRDATNRSVWWNLKEVLKEDIDTILPPIETVGWVIAETEECIRIAACRATDENGEEAVNSVWNIPRPWIIGVVLTGEENET